MILFLDVRLLRRVEIHLSLKSHGYSLPSNTLKTSGFHLGDLSRRPLSVTDAVNNQPTIDMCSVVLVNKSGVQMVCNSGHLDALKERGGKELNWVVMCVFMCTCTGVITQYI